MSSTPKVTKSWGVTKPWSVILGLDVGLRTLLNRVSSGEEGFLEVGDFATGVGETGLSILPLLVALERKVLNKELNSLDWGVGGAGSGVAKPVTSLADSDA